MFIALGLKLLGGRRGYKHLVPTARSTKVSFLQLLDLLTARTGGAYLASVFLPTTRAAFVGFRISRQPLLHVSHSTLKEKDHAHK